MDYDHFIVYDDANDAPYPEQPHQLYFLNILHLLPSIPPPILDIDIKVCLRYYYHPATACYLRPRKLLLSGVSYITRTMA